MSFTFDNWVEIPFFTKDPFEESNAESDNQTQDETEDSSTSENTENQSSDEEQDSTEDVTEDSSTSKEEETTPEIKGEEKQKSEDSALPFHKHPRWKQVQNEAKIAKTELAESKTQIKTLKTNLQAIAEKLIEYWIDIPLGDDASIVEALSEEIQVKKLQEAQIAKEEEMVLEIESKLQDLKEDWVLKTDEQIQDFLNIATDLADWDMDKAYKIYQRLEAKWTLSSQNIPETSDDTTEQTSAVPDQDDIDAAEQRYLTDRKKKEESARMKAWESIWTRRQNAIKQNAIKQNANKKTKPFVPVRDIYSWSIDIGQSMRANLGSY